LRNSDLISFRQKDQLYELVFFFVQKKMTGNSGHSFKSDISANKMLIVIRLLSH